jgi:hypothetical protein
MGRDEMGTRDEPCEGAFEKGWKWGHWGGASLMARTKRHTTVVGAVVRAVIVRTRSRWLTAVISHPSNAKAEVDNVNVRP